MVVIGWLTLNGTLSQRSSLGVRWWYYRVQVRFQMNFLQILCWPFISYHKEGEMGLTLTLISPEHVKWIEPSVSCSLSSSWVHNNFKYKFKIDTILCLFLKNSLSSSLFPCRLQSIFSSLPLTFSFFSSSISIYSSIFPATLLLNSAILTFWFHSSFISVPFLQVFSWPWL